MVGRLKGEAVTIIMTTGTIAMLSIVLSGKPLADTACPFNSFCDSFEEDDIGVVPRSPWTIESSGQPAIKIDGEEAYTGQKSVKITAKGKETAFLSLKGAPIFPLASNIMYGRSMVKLESTPRERVHWTMIEGKGRLADGGHVVEYRYGGSKPIEEDGVYTGSRLMANYETPNGPKTDCWHTAKNRTVMPTGRWICLAWAFNGPESSMKLWLDGKLLDDLSVNGVGQGCMGADANYGWQAPIFDQINIGWETYKEDETRTLWIDDVAIGEQPLDCPHKTDN